MIQFLIVALIFFFLGRYTLSTQDIEVAKKIFKKKSELGAVKRPTAEQLRKKGTLEEQGDKAMEETLRNIDGFDGVIG